jgi:hypothetical protein
MLPSTMRGLPGRGPERSSRVPRFPLSTRAALLNRTGACRRHPIRYRKRSMPVERRFTPPGSGGADYHGLNWMDRRGKGRPGVDLERPPAAPRAANLASAPACACDDQRAEPSIAAETHRLTRNSDLPTMPVVAVADSLIACPARRTYAFVRAMRREQCEALKCIGCGVKVSPEGMALPVGERNKF